MGPTCLMNSLTLVTGATVDMQPSYPSSIELQTCGPPVCGEKTELLSPGLLTQSIPQAASLKAKSGDDEGARFTDFDFDFR
jgi:hypothetical protein